jgi:hypothetical protein
MHPIFDYPLIDHIHDIILDKATEIDLTKSQYMPNSQSINVRVYGLYVQPQLQGILFTLAQKEGLSWKKEIIRTYTPNAFISI